MGDLGSIPRLGKSRGEGNGIPLQYSYLENAMDGGALWATLHGVAKSRTRLSDFTFFQERLYSVSIVSNYIFWIRHFMRDKGTKINKK